MRIAVLKEEQIKELAARHHYTNTERDLIAAGQTIKRQPRRFRGPRQPLVPDVPIGVPIGAHGSIRLPHSVQ
jgi:hypothetical protein